MKKALKKILRIITFLLALSVIYTFGYRAVFTFLENRSVKSSTQADLTQYGKGISWIREGNKKTLFFIPSTEEAAVSELYGSWLKELYEKQGVNIIVPLFNTRSLSPSLGSTIVNPDERTREIVNLFKVYSSMAGQNHKITVMSTGNGSLQALELAGLDVNIDKIILLSPLTGTPRPMGNFFFRLSGFPLLSYLMPWLPESYGKYRAGKADILNDSLNTGFEEKYGKFYPDFRNTVQYYRYARSAASETFDNIRANRIFLIYGDDDLSYSLEGFERMGDALKEKKCEVTVMRLASSGRMVLFDNDRERITDLIAILLQ